MKTILFTDTHFGVKQNSIHWLDSQLNFIYKQLLPYIEELKKQDEYVKLIHLGDVFDSRSSISTYIAVKVKEAFKQLSQKVDDFIIIAGNHDFYSPNSDEIDTINLILGDLDIQIFTNKYFLNSPNLYVPWYEWFDQKKLQDIINKHNIKYVYTHADIVTEPVDIKGPIIFSGHVHIPAIHKYLKNLGSCYALNFADANSERGFYELNDDGNLKFIPNTQSIRFWRLYDSEIFNINKDIKNNDYIELYISQTHMSEVKYVNKINEMSKLYKNIWIIPQVNIIENLSEGSFEGYDIENITREIIPEKLKNKFEKIINNI